MYYIYHIPERNKIGATDDVTRRMKEHKWTGFYEILEEHDCIYKVSDREHELQRQYGYTVDKKKYWQVRKMRSKASSIKGGINARSLTYETAQYIRTQYKRGKDVFGNRISYRRIAKALDIPHFTIVRDIVKNKTYTTP